MEDLERPLPPRSASAQMRAWLDWFGFARIIGSALAMLAVCAGAYWLVRSPPPPTEASLPVVSTTVTSEPAALDPAPVDPLDGRGAVVDSVVVVHVAGAVARPGVYELTSGSRVDAALAAAGGPLAGANPDALNLAAPLVDGSRVHVPMVGEEVLTPLDVDSANGTSAPQILDINVATTLQLESLPGVGPATATAIVTERVRNGPFLSIDDLDRVAGIGPAKIDALRDLVTT